MIFVTGGTGFFGRALLRHWMASKEAGSFSEDVGILTRSPQVFLDSYPEFSKLSWLKLFEGDVLEYSSLPKNIEIDRIIHAATESTNGAILTPYKTYNDITIGTINILNFAVKNNVERFLLTSSGAVYGPQPDSFDKIPEDYLGRPDPLLPSSAYGLGKSAAEHLCCLYSDKYGLQTVIARCFAFVGQDLPLTVHYAMGNFIHDAVYGTEINVGGDGTPLRSYMNQADLARWLLCIFDEGLIGHAYNVGSDQAISISDLAHLVRDILSPNKSVVFKNTASTFKGRNVYIPDISAARNDLNLQITISLRESIEEFIRLKCL
jgi:UDP-glucuronate decarboxylase